ncbi:hypothetical protein ACWD45_32480 [Streptomyces rubiginosohelvolus]
MTFTVAPLATPESNATASAHLSTPPRRSTAAPLARLCHTTGPEHPHLGPVVELTALGPDPYQPDRDHSLMKTVLRRDHSRYEVTDQRAHLLVRRLSDAELHARVAPYLAALTADPEAAHTLEVNRVERSESTGPQQKDDNEQFEIH